MPTVGEAAFDHDRLATVGRICEPKEPRRVAPTPSVRTRMLVNVAPGERGKGIGGGMLTRLRLLTLFGQVLGGHVDAALALAVLLGGERAGRCKRKRRADNWLSTRFLAAEIDWTQCQFRRSPVRAAVAQRPRSYSK